MYPWTVYDDIETRDAAQYADHVDDFLAKAQNDDKPFHLVVGEYPDQHLTWTDLSRSATDVVASHDTHRDMSRGGFANNQGPFDPRVKPYKTTPDKVDIPDWLVDTPGLRQELVEYYECESLWRVCTRIRLRKIHRADIFKQSTDSTRPLA